MGTRSVGGATFMVTDRLPYGNEPILEIPAPILILLERRNWDRP
jgi:hypothetical protein